MEGVTRLTESFSDLNQLYDFIFKHIISVSFGKEVYDDESLKKNLREAIPLMHAELCQKVQTGATEVSNVIALSRCCKAVDEKKLKPTDHRRLCYEAALVMLHYLNFYNNSEKTKRLMKSTNELFERYPEFVARGPLDEAESQALLQFQNFMVVAIELITPQNHKNHLLDLVTRICEGKQAKYITGSGETVATTRRVKIFRREGNVIATPKKVKTKAERIAMKEGRLGNNDNVADDSESEGSNDDENSSKKRDSTSISAPKGPLKKRHNHRQLDILVENSEQFPKPNFSSIVGPEPVAPPQCFKTLADVAAMVSNATASGIADFVPVKKGGLDFNQCGINTLASFDNNPLAASRIPSHLSEDVFGNSLHRQTSIETVGTAEHPFFRDALMKNPGLFNVPLTRGLSAESLDSDAAESLVLLRSQST